MLHGLLYWGGSRSKLRSKTGLAGPKHHGSARNLAFFHVKWLQPAMKSTSCVRRVRLRSFHGSSYVFCNESLCLRASFYAVFESLVADCIGMAA